MKEHGVFDHKLIHDRMHGKTVHDDMHHKNVHSDMHFGHESNSKNRLGDVFKKK